MYYTPVAVPVLTAPVPASFLDEILVCPAEVHSASVELFALGHELSYDLLSAKVCQLLNTFYVRIGVCIQRDLREGIVVNLTS